MIVTVFENVSLIGEAEGKQRNALEAESRHLGE